MRLQPGDSAGMAFDRFETMVFTLTRHCHGAVQHNRLRIRALIPE